MLHNYLFRERMERLVNYQAAYQRMREQIELSCLLDEFADRFLSGDERLRRLAVSAYAESAVRGGSEILGRNRLSELQRLYPEEHEVLVSRYRQFLAEKLR